MTVDQAVKKFKLEPLNVYTAKAKAKELNVDEVLYMNVQKNKYAYIVKMVRVAMCSIRMKKVFIPRCTKDLR